MTDPKGNSKFCFPEIFDALRAEAEENTESRGGAKLTVSRGASY